MALEPLTAILDIGGKLIDKLFPDPAKKAEALLKLRELEQAGELTAMGQQVQINLIDAQSKSRFQSWWRPAAGWVLVSGMAVAFVLSPITTLVAAIFGQALPLLVLPIETMMPMLVAMLGLGAYRSYDKKQGTN